jgi:hypothetical protein
LTERKDRIMEMKERMKETKKERKKNEEKSLLA